MEILEIVRQLYNKIKIIKTKKDFYKNEGNKNIL